jgi:hypothetical protein
MPNHICVVETNVFFFLQVTRGWFTACVASTVLTAAGMIQPGTIHLDWHPIIYRFQIWRIVTNFCFLGKFGWPFVMNLIFMVLPPPASPAAHGNPALSCLSRPYTVPPEYCCPWHMVCTAPGSVRQDP